MERNDLQCFSAFFTCCKLNDINPQKWFQYSLKNIANQKANKLHELLPIIIIPDKLNSFRKFWEV
jgi:hypothetical protein